MKRLLDLLLGEKCGHCRQRVPDRHLVEHYRGGCWGVRW